MCRWCWCCLHFQKLRKKKCFVCCHQLESFSWFWTRTLFTLANVAAHCRSEVYWLARHLWAVCSSRCVMHHLWKKVNVNTRCHGEKRSLRYVGFSQQMKAVTGRHWNWLLLLVTYELWLLMLTRWKRNRTACSHSLLVLLFLILKEV